MQLGALVRRKPALAVLAALLPLSLLGCAATSAEGALRDRVARKRACPSDRLSVTSLGASAYRVEGCGAPETFICIEYGAGSAPRREDPSPPSASGSSSTRLVRPLRPATPSRSRRSSRRPRPRSRSRLGTRGGLSGSHAHSGRTLAPSTLPGREPDSLAERRAPPRPTPCILARLTRGAIPALATLPEPTHAVRCCPLPWSRGPRPPPRFASGQPLPGEALRRRAGPGFRRDHPEGWTAAAGHGAPGQRGVPADRRPRPPGGRPVPPGQGGNHGSRAGPLGHPALRRPGGASAAPACATETGRRVELLCDTSFTNPWPGLGNACNDQRASYGSPASRTWRTSSAWSRTWSRPRSIPPEERDDARLARAVLLGLPLPAAPVLVPEHQPGLLQQQVHRSVRGAVRLGPAHRPVAAPAPAVPMSDLAHLVRHVGFRRSPSAWREP